MTGIDFLDRAPLSLLVLLSEVVVVFVAAFLLYRLCSVALTGLGSLAWLDKHQESFHRLRSLLRRQILAGAFLILLMAEGASLYLMYRGVDLVAAARRFAEAQFPADFWAGLAVAVAQVAVLVLATWIGLILIGRLLDATSRWMQKADGIQANDESIERLFLALKRIASRGAGLFVLGRAAGLVGLPAAVVEFTWAVLKIYLFIALGQILWRTVDAAVATIDGLGERYAQSKELGRYYERLRPLIPLMRRTIEYLIYLMVASLVVLQIEPIAPFASWGTRLMRVLGFFFLTRVVLEVAYLLFEELLTRGDPDTEQKQPRLTLVPLVRSFLKYTAYSIFGIAALKEFGFDPTPVLAAAGIAGLAVGFGAQSLISDVVAGLFTLFEAHYLVGDYIATGEARGLVEAIDLRTTRIRDDEGRHHILRNAEIGDVVNYSKEYTCSVVEIGVAYTSDLSQVTRILEQAGREASVARQDILEPTRVQGIEVFAERSLILRTVTPVKPGRHVAVERDLRRRFKESFDENGIEIAPTISLEGMPFPMH